MDAPSAKAIREYVSEGGTVLMTAFSAKVDEHGQWFNTPLPGRLNDVFGLRTSEFYKPEKAPQFELDGKLVKGHIRFYEVLEPETAVTFARFTNIAGQPPAVTVSKYGKGQAIYFAAPAQRAFIDAILRKVRGPLRIQTGPCTPEGVYARVVDGRTLYVNTTDAVKSVMLGKKSRGVLSHKSYENEMKLGPYEAELVQ